MHPAFSVIFFTTASGAGYGLLALLGLLGPAGVIPAERWFGVAAFGFAFGAVSIGLASSTLHLGHPERSWRALTQWRSSWLSREGVLALATYVPAGLFAIGWVFLEDSGGAWGVLGVGTALLAAVTIGCTAMIYRSLKPIHQWCNGFVMPAYLLAGAMTGALWLNALAHLFGVAGWVVTSVALAATVATWLTKAAYWRFIDATASVSTPNTATGLRTGQVRLMDAPHTEDNYLLKEMGYRVGRKHARRLRRVAQIAGYALPLALVALTPLLPSTVAAAVAGLAALSASLGVIVERWLFFAEAKHTVTLYYGVESV